MPDNLTAVGPVSAPATANAMVTSDPTAGLSLAAPAVPAQAPVPVDQGDPNGVTPAAQLAIPVSIPEATAPLSENVSPFNKPPTSPYQQVEYVPITQPLPATPQQVPTAVPQAAPAAVPVAQPLQPAAAPVLPPTPPSAVDPTARTVLQPMPAGPAAAPGEPDLVLNTLTAPAAAVAPASPPDLELNAQIPPLQAVGIGLNTPVAAPAPAAPVSTPVQAPALMQPQPVPMAAAPAAAYSQPAPAAPVPVPAAAPESVPLIRRPLIIFSDNTWAIWKARQSTKLLYLFAIIGFGLVLLGVIMYWVSIGAPTHLEDLPFLKNELAG